VPVLKLRVTNVLAFRNLAFSYSRNKTIFTDLNLDIQAGRTLLLGPNGSGKSTLFALASGALQPRSGQVLAQQSIGLLPQKVPIFPNLTVEEQVAYVAWLAMKPIKAADADAQRSLAQMNLNHKLKEKPKNLSGGELRRMGIAGLLNSDVETLLLDEPTAGLDIAQCANLYQTLKLLPREHNVIVSTHQLDGISDFFDYVVLLFNGEVLFDSTMEEFMRIGSKKENQITSDPLVNAYSNFVGSSL